MNRDRVSIPIGADRPVSAIWTRPDSRGGGLGFAYAPGASSNLQDRFGAFLSEELLRANASCVRFQFPYMEARRRRPDRPPILEETWRSVIGWAAGKWDRIVIGGRSMGGRIASQVVSQGTPVSGLALFAYPLHPPGRPDQVRDSHLAQISVPTLFCSGTRDAFASPAELSEAAARVPRSRVHLLEGADHGFNVLKPSGRTRQEVWAEAVVYLLAFLETVN